MSADPLISSADLPPFLPPETLGNRKLATTLQNTSATGPDALVKKLLVPSSHFFEKIGGWFGGGILSADPRKTRTKSKSADKIYTSQKRARHQPVPECVADGPSYHYKTDGSGPATCGGGAMLRGQNPKSADKIKIRGKTRTKSKKQELRVGRKFLVSQAHPWHTRTLAEYFSPRFRSSRRNP